MIGAPCDMIIGVASIETSNFFLGWTKNSRKTKTLTSGRSSISPGGAPTPQGAPTYDFAKFSRKLREIERIWAPGGATLLTDPKGVGDQPLPPRHPARSNFFSFSCSSQHKSCSISEPSFGFSGYLRLSPTAPNWEILDPPFEKRMNWNFMESGPSLKGITVDSLR